MQNLAIICHTTELVRGMGLPGIPGLMSQTDLHRIKSFQTCMQRSLWHQTRKRPITLTCSVMWQMMAGFRNFYSLQKVKIWVKKGKKAQCVSNRCKDLFTRKKYFGVRCTLRTTYLIFETFQILFPTASLIFTAVKLFHEVIWERTKH